MIQGVSFQPNDPQRSERGSGPNASNAPQGVQEAIKILSLRLPRVVGARASSPQALLSSPGAGGNPRVDSVVNQVMQKFFPTASMGAMPPVPGAPPTLGQPRPGVSGSMPVSPPVRFPDNRPEEPRSSPVLGRPRISVDQPFTPPPPTQMPSPSFQGNPWESMTFSPPATPPIQWPELPMFGDAVPPI